jgi:integrase
VPLAPRSIALLKALPREEGSNFVFIGERQGQPLHHGALRKTVKRINATVTTHGFRSCFRDWCAERTSFPNHICEMALGHAIQSGVEAAYRRGDLIEQRTKLMDAWARFCEIEKCTPADVLPLRAKGF